MSWLRGSHQIKFGVDIMAPMKNEYFDVAPTRGNLRFRRRSRATRSPTSCSATRPRPSCPTSTWCNQRQLGRLVLSCRTTGASDRLTLNLGLRYDFMTPQMDADNRWRTSTRSRASWSTPTDGSSPIALWSSRTGTTSRRASASSIKANTATVIRGGYGIFYNLVDRIGSEDQLALNPPGLRNISITAPAGSTTPAFMLRRRLSAELPRRREHQLPRPAAAGGPARWRELDVPPGRARCRTAARRQLRGIGGRDRLVGRNITLLRNLNQPANGNGARPYPNFGAIQYRDHAGESRYRGLDLSLEKRFSEGYSYRVSYTLGDQRDNTPEHLSAASPRPQNTNDLAAWEGPGDNDIRHRFVSSFIADLPLGDHPIARDWLVAGILTAHTGRPFTVTQGSLEGAGWVPNRIAETDGERTVDNWFNVSDFQVVPAGTFGNAGRNILRGPGWMTIDVSLQRRIAIRNSLAATLRYDVFNLTNRTNFGNPNVDVTASNRATITSLAGDPRSMQFSIRLEF